MTAEGWICLEPLTHLAYTQGMIRLAQSIKENWWHRLYLVIMRPFAVISVLGLAFCIRLLYVCASSSEAFVRRGQYELASSCSRDGDYYFKWAVFFLFAWPLMFVLYRAILFVVFGKEAFVTKQSH